MNKEMPNPTPVFHGQLKRVIDGDTLTVKLDRFFSDESAKTVRLLEVDTPELRGGTKETRGAGNAAKEFVLAWLAEASLPLSQAWPDIWPLVVQSGPIDSFGRTLAYLWRKSDGECLNYRLIDAGHGIYVPPLLHIQKLTAT